MKKNKSAKEAKDKKRQISDQLTEEQASQVRGGIGLPDRRSTTGDEPGTLKGITSFRPK